MKITKSCLLLVEGQDEKDFCNALLKHLTLENVVQVEAFQDDTIENANLRITLQNIINDTDYEKLERLGIIRDSEFAQDFLQSTQSDINRANRIRPQYSLPIPQEEFELASGSPALGILMLPGHGIEGMFEDVLLEAYQDDPTMDCVNHYFQCLIEKNIEFIPNRVAKSRTRVFLVSKMISISESRSDNWLRNVYQREWWSWDKPAFERIVQFVKHIAGA